MMNVKNFLIVFIGVLLSAGCQTTQKKTADPGAGIKMPVNSGNVHAEISEIENKEGPIDNAEDILQLSFLYSHTLNPKPDFNKSLGLMERYMSMVPKEKRFKYANYIWSLLKKIKEQEKILHKQKKLLKDEKKEKRSLIRQNDVLQKKINSLKKLDIRLEKQRLSAE